jgi:nucleoside-diphosphate-sugar epimerase
VVGFFSDYYAISHIKTHMPPLCFAVDIDAKKAAIPGTGNEVIAFTYSFDVARFVAAFLDLENWSETTYCYGEKTTFNEFVKLAEELLGKFMS